MAKIEIPDNLKADLPPTVFGRILSATPVVMTVIATMLAGLASSEMTKAQYDRSLAAQQQSKAGDQWSFFQAKRQRAAIQNGDYDLLQATSEVRKIDPLELKAASMNAPDMDKVSNLLASPAGQTAFDYLQKGELPAIAEPAPLPQEIRDASSAIEALKPADDIAALLAKVSNSKLDESIRIAKDQTDAFDAATKPVNQTIEALYAILLPQTPSQAKRDFIAARMHFAALRYDMEARLNQAIANLYELQVRKNNLSAERHHAKSKKFFFGMLAAQMAVIISTFAMAARKRNLLWGLAAVAGVTALIFAGYVYLYV